MMDPKHAIPRTLIRALVMGGATAGCGGAQGPSPETAPEPTRTGHVTASSTPARSSESAPPPGHPEFWRSAVRPLCIAVQECDPQSFYDEYGSLESCEAVLMGELDAEYSPDTGYSDECLEAVRSYYWCYAAAYDTLCGGSTEPDEICAAEEARLEEVCDGATPTDAAPGRGRGLRNQASDPSY